MSLAFLHLIHLIGLGALAAAYHYFPHLWQGQGVFFLALACAGSASLSMVGIGIWAMATKESSSSKVAMHAAIALVWSAGIAYYAYRVAIDYHLMAYLRGKIGI